MPTKGKAALRLGQKKELSPPQLQLPLFDLKHKQETNWAIIIELLMGNHQKPGQQFTELVIAHGL